MTNRSRSPRIRLAAALLPLILLAGCGPDKFYHDVYPTSGTLLKDGKPVVGAQVTFHPLDPAAVALPEDEQGPPVASPTTRTDAGGSFSMSTYYADDGVPAGDYAVTIFQGPDSLIADPSTEDEELEIPVGLQYRRDRSAVDQLGGAYLDAESTPLRATVLPEESNRFDFVLEQ